jgi:hypothetical protein
MECSKASILRKINNRSVSNKFLSLDRSEVLDIVNSEVKTQYDEPQPVDGKHHTPHLTNEKVWKHLFKELGWCYTYVSRETGDFGYFVLDFDMRVVAVCRSGDSDREHTWASTTSAKNYMVLNPTSNVTIHYDDGAGINIGVLKLEQSPELIPITIKSTPDGWCMTGKCAVLNDDAKKMTVSVGDNTESLKEFARLVCNTSFIA